LPDYEALREATVAAGRASGSPELEIDPDLDPQPRRCAHCGRGPFAAELRYCGYCGARIALGDAQGGASAEAGAGT